MDWETIFLVSAILVVWELGRAAIRALAHFASPDDMVTIAKIRELRRAVRDLQYQVSTLTWHIRLMQQPTSRWQRFKRAFGFSWRESEPEKLPEWSFTISDMQW